MAGFSRFSSFSSGRAPAPPGLRAQALPAAVEATSGVWFPAASYFAPTLADPGEIPMAVGLYATDLFDPSKPVRERPDFTFSDPASMRRDVHGAVALGGTLPLARAGTRGPRPPLRRAGRRIRPLPCRGAEPRLRGIRLAGAMPVEFFVDRLSAESGSCTEARTSATS